MTELPRYRVSTITSVGDVYTCLNLVQILRKFPLGRQKSETDDPWFSSAKMGDYKRTWMDQDIEALADGEGDRDDLVSCTSSKVRDYFGNQVTLVLEIDDTRINLKAFKNGRIQMTGVKNIEQGSRAIEHFASVLREAQKTIYSFAVEPDKLLAGDYRVCLINSDFDLGFPIKRDRLYSFVREAFPDVLCTYEPCNYHGVKFKYMWNESNKNRPGICRCKDGFCRGNGDGSGEGKCRKVTVAVFQSGKVIATGAQKIRQLEDAIRFIRNVVCSKENSEWFSLKGSDSSVA